jgi:hypothetical protein
MEPGAMAPWQGGDVVEAVPRALEVGRRHPRIQAYGALEDGRQRSGHGGDVGDGRHWRAAALGGLVRL